jgi:hypothetical protein
MAMEGLLKEAEAKDTAALEGILEEYGTILSENNTNIVCTRRMKKLPWSATVDNCTAYHEATHCPPSLHGTGLRRHIVIGTVARVLTNGCGGVV